MDIFAQALEVVAARTQQHEHEQREELEHQIVFASMFNTRRISKKAVLEAMELVDYDLLGSTKQCSVLAA